MRHLCVTVTEAAPAAERHLEALIESLAHQRASVDVVLVVRGAAPGVASYAREGVRVHPVASPRRIGLSAARNLALAHARRSGLLDEAGAVCFPDDDCVYPPGLLASVERELARTGCDVVTGSYGPRLDAIDRARFPAGARPHTRSLIMRCGSSGTIFATAAAVRRIGDFDERLGLGARYGASEDADYLLRALRAGLDVQYRPTDLVVLHPYKEDRPAQYYVGNVAVLAKHARGRSGTGLLLARRLLGGLVMAARSELPARELRSAAGAALALLDSTPRFDAAR